MSIRLRLTLLYTAILMLTLSAFGVALYTIQSRSTLDSIKGELRNSSMLVENSLLQNNPYPQMPNPMPQTVPPAPMAFQQFSDDQVFRRMQERQITRILDAGGNLIASPFGSSADVLPLSEEGLAAVQAQETWWETQTVNGERLLIYTSPVISDGEVVFITQVARPLTERDNALQALGATLLVASLLAALAAFGIGWLMAGLTLQPIHRITQTARAIGKERDFSRRVEYKGPPDEIGELATTFNSMLGGLQDGYQRVAHSLEMQRNFVADVSHELRTPLTTLRGNLDLLRRTPPIPAEEQADILQDTADESDRLIRLVNDLLVLARADAGRNLAKDPLEVSMIVHEVCRQARQLDPDRTIEHDINLDLRILGDRDAFKQVLLILLDNALKHSSGDIVICARSTDTRVTLEVRDTGEGITPEVLEHVFDRFYRGVDGSEAQGFGLGMPIARALVEGMGGTIEMQSEPGQGSTVTLGFPRVENVAAE